MAQPLEIETPFQAITRMNNNLYPTTTIITSSDIAELVILSPLTLKEFLVEIQIDRLIDGLAAVEFGNAAFAVEDAGSLKNLEEGKEATQELKDIMSGTMQEVDDGDEEVDMQSTTQHPASVDFPFADPDSSQDTPLTNLDFPGSGLSATEAIDVDQKAAQEARNKEVVRVILQEMVRGEHGPDLMGDAEVLLDEEIEGWDVRATGNIETLGDRARVSSKALVVARMRMGW